MKHSASNNNQFVPHQGSSGAAQPHSYNQGGNMRPPYNNVTNQKTSGRPGQPGAGGSLHSGPVSSQRNASHHGVAPQTVAMPPRDAAAQQRAAQRAAAARNAAPHGTGSRNAASGAGAPAGFVPTTATYSRGDAGKYSSKSHHGRHPGVSQPPYPTYGGGGAGVPPTGGFVSATAGGGKGGPHGPKQGKSKKNVWRVILIVSLIILLIAGGVLGVMIHGYMSGTKTYDAIEQEAFTTKDATDLASFAIDWDNLEAKNPDIVAWVYVPGTAISYPVVQGENDEEYLQKNFLNEDTALVHKGTIFLSEHNKADFSDQANFLFGHNMNDDTMFGDVMDMFDQEVFDACHTVYILTPEMNYRAETFALTIVPSTSVSVIQPNFDERPDMNTYMSDQIRDSKVEHPEAFDTSSVDKIFAFITCGDDYANTRAILYSGVVESAVPDINGSVVLDSDGDGVADEEPSKEKKD